MTIVNMPAAWPGPPSEAAANHATHVFAEVGNDEWYCLACDCKPWHVAASWPCGMEPPRVVRCTQCVRHIKHEHSAHEQAALDEGMH